VIRPRWRLAAAYAVALLLSVMALSASLLMAPQLARNQLALFGLSAIVAGLLGGVGPGLSAALLGIGLVNFFLVEPLYTLALKEGRDLSAFLGFSVLALIGSAVRGARERAAAATRARELLVASLSHDLKHPLTAIQAETDLACGRLERLGRAAVEQVGDRLSRITAGSRRSEQMIAELVDLSRLESGEVLALDTQPIDLFAIASRTIEKHRAIAYGHALRLDGLPGAVVGRWDYFRLERVLANLAGNALKFSAEGTEVVVAVAPDCTPGWARLTVADQGMGISAAELPHVFEPFRRGAKVHAGTPGHGIGLAGVRQIVQAHGGTIAVDSREGAGTTVTVRLPMAPPNGAHPLRRRLGI